MKKLVLDQAEHMVAASVPTVIFVTIFVFSVVWVFTRKPGAFDHIANTPLD